VGQIAPKHPGFEHKLVRSETRTLIESTCKKCGLSKEVSVSDGSLHQWEGSHVCVKVSSLGMANSRHGQRL